jgi:hypothetical protein
MPVTANRAAPEQRHVIYDPVSKQALLVGVDSVVSVPGMFQNFMEANVAGRAMADEIDRKQAETPAPPINE